MHHLLNKLSHQPSVITGRLYSAFGFSRHFGERPLCYGIPVVQACEGSTIHFAKRVTLISCSRMTALGVPHPCIIRTMCSGACIEIGEDAGISGSSVVAAIGVQIGARVLLGAGVRIFDTDFHTIAAKNRRFESEWTKIGSAPVTIEDDVFVGTGAIICKGVTIGRGSVIAAGSVVVKDVPSMTIVGGNPAKQIGNVPA